METSLYGWYYSITQPTFTWMETADPKEKKKEVKEKGAGGRGECGGELGNTEETGDQRRSG